MKLGLVAVGRLKSGPEQALCARYDERREALGRSLGLAFLPTVEIAESRARRPEDRKVEEGRAILAGLPADAVAILCDERGTSESSDAFAARLARWRDAGRPAACLVIGGADGLDPALRARADHVLSFGAFTIPHQIVRILASEQLYRAMTILAGHPYHRA
jgi:23S rRNA (pseudouridine1915-N3)-methyltransferase